MNDNSFSSIDKLIEFGMGMGIAQQMINTMNHSLNSMYIQKTNQSINQAKTTYYAIIDNQQLGPLNEDEISSLIVTKNLTEDTFVWKSGMSGWKLAKNIPEIYKYIVLNRK